MDATLRLDSPRRFSPAAAPLGRTLPSKASKPEDQTLRASELVDRLCDALLGTFSLGAWEEQVLHHVLLGRNTDAIARRLGIRETTVHKHMHRIFAKTKTAGRRELFDLGLRLAASRSIFSGSSFRAAA